MLALQHSPVTSPSFFSPPAIPNQSSIPESPSFQNRARRSSRSPLNPGLSSAPSTPSSYVASPGFLSAEMPAASSQNAQIPPSTGSRLRFEENRNDQDTTGTSNLVPESLLSSTLPEGRFIETFREIPTALAALITFLHGPHELLSFCHVSKEMRDLVEGSFDHEDQVRDAFLLRSISGYQPSTSHKATWLNRAIKIDLTDLELLRQYKFSISQSLYWLTCI
jgi:hypothetical protein